jgi:serine/threonine-protein kinase
MGEKPRRFGKYLLFEQISGDDPWRTWRARAAPGGHSVQLTTLDLDRPDLGRFFPIFVEEMSRAGFLFHAGVKRIHEFGQIEGTPFFTEEDVAGTDLSSFLEECRRQRVPVPVPCALFVCREVASALAYAHERRLQNGTQLGVVHTAVLPRNVVIGDKGDVKLGGFGLWRATYRGALLGRLITDGSRHLLAQEVLEGAGLGPRTDVYGCAALLYYLLTFRSPREAALGRKVPPPSSLRARVSPAIDAVCAVTLSEDPGERHSTCEELEVELSRILYKESPLFAARDLGDFVRAIHDGSAARSLEHRRRSRPPTDPRRDDGDTGEPRAEQVWGRGAPPQAPPQAAPEPPGPPTPALPAGALAEEPGPTLPSPGIAKMVTTRRRWPWWLAFAAIAAAAAATVWWQWRS